jgi:hypothetical protein
MKQQCSLCRWYGRYKRRKPKRTFNANPTLRITEGQLYLLLISSATEEFIKVGITKQTIRQRTAKWAGVDIVQLMSFVGTSKDILRVEKDILYTFAEHQYVPQCLPDGYTECFYMDSLLDICEYIDAFVTGEEVVNPHTTSRSRHRSLD